MKTTTITRLGALLMVWAAATAACSAAASQDAPTAAQPKGVPVAIEAHQPLDGDGTFVTSGGAGLCPSGTHTDTSTLTEIPNGPHFDITKAFTCDDGSGTFDLRIKASMFACGANSRGNWYITGGTGAYKRMTGSGDFRGTYYASNGCFADGVDDDLVGKVSGGPAA